MARFLAANRGFVHSVHGACTLDVQRPPEVDEAGARFPRAGARGRRGTPRALSSGSGRRDAQAAGPLRGTRVSPPPDSAADPRRAHVESKGEEVMGSGAKSRWRIALDTRVLNDAAVGKFVGGIEKVSQQSSLMQVPVIAAIYAALSKKN